MMLYMHGLGPLGSGKKTTSQHYGMTLEELMRKARVVGDLAKNIIEKKTKYHPYDLYSMLFKKRDEMDLALVKNEKGFNIQHIIVEAGRPEYFEVTFYLNLWDKLRMQLTISGNDPLYAGYTPRGLAEKLLYKPLGPATLEEYDYFDELWLQMPLLHKACLRGYLTYVELISSKSSDINEMDPSCATCVLYACAQGSAGIVSFLLNKGADPTLENKRGENGLIMACKFGKCDIVKILLSRFIFDQQHVDHAGQRAIDYVAMNGDIQTLAAFIEHNIQPDGKMATVAARHGRDQMLQHLIVECGVSCSSIDDGGRTPLLNAALNNSVNMLKFLCELDVDITHRDKENRNCFHLVAESNHVEACRYLIERARSKDLLKDMIDVRDFYSGRDELKVVRGRDHGRKAWHYANINRTLACLYDKKKSSGQIDVKNFGEILASGLGQNPGKELIREYEDKMADTLKKRLPDMTPLMLAAWKNQKDVALLLLEAGANPHITDHYGSTPLHMAAVWGNLKLACALEKHGIDLNAENDEQKKALDVADANEHELLVNFLSGKEYFEAAENFLRCVDEAVQKLSDEELSNLRSSGVDIRRHLISTVRDLQIDIGKSLLDLKSGPVVEESCNTENLQPADFRSEFAGNKAVFMPLPSSKDKSQ